MENKSDQRQAAAADMVLGLAAILAGLSILILPIALIWRLAAGLWGYFSDVHRFCDLGDFLGFVRHHHVHAGDDEPMFKLGDSNVVTQSILSLDMLAVALAAAVILATMASVILDVLPGWLLRDNQRQPLR